MIFKMMRVNKKGQVVNKIVILVIALIVIAMMAFLAYKYILGTGVQIGVFTTCSGQGPGSKCVVSAAQCTNGEIRNIGCPETDADKQNNKNFCCVPINSS